jgi:hypothetical protein
MIEDDPVLGKYVALHGIDRLRLLFLAGAALGAVGLASYIALGISYAGWVQFATFIIPALVTLGVGWYLLHLWNREIILYERGFSYREGSRLVAFLYDEIQSVRRKGERLAYFGGRVRRDVHVITVTTRTGEVLVLTDQYRRADELGIALEKRVNAVLRPEIEARLANGEIVSFGGLGLDALGLRQGEQALAWRDVGGYRVEARQLHILDASGAVWGSAPLAEMENITLFLDILKTNSPQITANRLSAAGQTSP